VIAIRKAIVGERGRIFIFGFLSAIAPLSIDIYLPALLFTLSAFFIGFGTGQLLLGPVADRAPRAGRTGMEDRECPRNLGHDPKIRWL
jgi:MFS family permease